jgi:uncharacterized protein YlxP (DUF503 family)
MTFGLVIARLHLPQVRSLKQKRRIIKSLTDRLHRRYRVSIAETDFHDVHQRSEISIAIVHGNEHELQRMLDGIRRAFDSEPDAELTEWLPELLEGAG